MDKRLLVVGAGGDVGQGIVEAALDRKMRVIAAGRTRQRLLRYAEKANIATVIGDLATPASAEALWESASEQFSGVDAVVLAVNAPNVARRLDAWTSKQMTALYGENLLTHFHAIKTMLPRLPADGLFIGMGGGTADFILPGMAHLSIMQSAQRMMYRGFAKERSGGAQIRELMMVSMVNGERKRDIAEPHWITAREVGQHICAVVEDPDLFPGPILRLETRDQIGKVTAQLERRGQ